MNYKDIEKEFDKYKGYFLRNSYHRETKSFLKTKINQVIDDMIGEEREMKSRFYNELLKRQGYNQKVSELKEYKKKFNK